MKLKIAFFLISIVWNFVSCAKSSSMTVKSIAAQQQKMPLLIGVIGQDNQELESFAHFAKIILDRKNQKTSGFMVTVQSFEKIPSKKNIKQLATDGIPLTVFITSNADGHLEWRMYDTRYASMVRGQRFAHQNMPIKNRAEHLADQLWPVLTGQEGFFTSRIAFCKEVQQSDQKPQKRIGQKHISVVTPYADPAQENYSELIDNLIVQGRSFAPRWNKDSNNPLLLYSEATLANVRLMSVNMHKQRRVVSNFEGLNILPSFSSDGNKVVYCLSRNGKSHLYLYEYDKDTEKPLLKKITNNAGNNISPTLRDNGDIIFCSDFQGKSPQICYYHAFTQQVDVLTSDGYCACPNFCEKNGKVAYCKFINGVMQLCSYDVKTRNHEQITFDRGNKEECSWSPCGNYLAFVVDNGSSSRIAVLNVLTHEKSFITSTRDRCTYPSWSPNYGVPLIVS